MSFRLGGSCAPLLLAAALLCWPGAATARAAGDWPEFGYDAARSNSGPAQTGITPANVARLRRRTVALDGTVDSSPVYIHAALVEGRRRDAVFVTTSYGRTEALDASTGALLWRFTPPGYASLAGSGQITNASPLVDPSRTALYAAAPDGRIRKLSVASGAVLWSTSVTRDPTREKLASALNYAHGLVIATTGGYFGDAPSYQGHVVTLDSATGALVGVWNALCSGRRELIVPSSCPESDAGIWARSGAVVVPGSGDLLVATGNGLRAGGSDFGDSVLLLSPTANALRGHWTPADAAALDRNDTDLGSTAPALLGGTLLQGGKDGLLRLLSLARLSSRGARDGGVLQTEQAPGGAEVYAAPAVWNARWVFLATASGTAAWQLVHGHLRAAWSNTLPGTSPVVAGGLLYVEGDGGIAVYLPASGRKLAELPLGAVHWQSPIVVDGRVVAAEGNANDHATSGQLDIYRLP